MTNNTGTATSTGNEWFQPLMVVSPAIAFLLVSFSLGELGDGLNIFQGIYLVGLGWNEGAVGTALSIVRIITVLLWYLGIDDLVIVFSIFLFFVFLFFFSHEVSQINVFLFFFSSFLFPSVSSSSSLIILYIIFMNEKKMGFTSLIIQPLAGDLVDKTNFDRRHFLRIASVVTAISASMILFVRQGNLDHGLIYISKLIEGVASSFINPCLAALTLASFGPNHFDSIMASNILWGHVGSVVAAILAGFVAYELYPNIKFCFIVISLSALLAVFFVQFLPEGDPLMGRGFQGKVALDEDGHIEELTTDRNENNGNNGDMENSATTMKDDDNYPVAAGYMEVFADRRSFVLCITGFFFQ